MFTSWLEGPRGGRTVIGVDESVIAGVAGTANALDAKTFWEQMDRDHN